MITGIAKDELRSRNKIRKTRPKAEAFAAPTDRTCAAVVNHNLIDVACIEADHAKRHGNEVKVVVRCLARIADFG